MIHSLRAGKTIRKFTSFEEADRADAAYYSSLTPQRRVEILLEMVAQGQPQHELLPGLEWVEIEPSAEEENRGAVVSEGAETTGIALDGLDFRVSSSSFIQPSVLSRNPSSISSARS